MRILSKFNRLTVILTVLLLVVAITYFVTEWMRREEVARTQAFQQYLDSYHCQSMGPTPRGDQIVYRCAGILFHASEIQEIVAMNSAR